MQSRHDNLRRATDRAGVVTLDRRKRMQNAGNFSMDTVAPDDRLAEFCLDNASVSFFRIAENGRILYVNHRACDMVGYSRDELLSMSLFDMDPDLSPKAVSEIWRELCDNGTYAFETNLRRKDGTRFPVEVTANMIEYDGHRYAISLAQDITERNRLFESQRIAQFIFDRASFGIFLIREGGRIATVNEHACRYLGYTRDELRRMNILDIDRKFSPDESQNLWRRLRTEKAINFKTVHRCKDGSEIPVMTTANLLVFDDRRYSVSFVQDLTEWKREEAKRAELETHMREAQKMESLGTLAGGIAHDFNNILAAILGYSELAKLKGRQGVDVGPYVEKISLAGMRAKNLVQQILTFSRQGEAEKRPIDISRALEDALKLIRATTPSTIEIKTHIPPHLAPVFANETHIHQIVMNLCGNACHAMRDGGGVMDISLGEVTVDPHTAQRHASLSSGKYLKVSVADTGCGIPQEAIDRIFDPYFTTKPVGEGTGMGLSTVHGIVTDHGGGIKVHSEMDGGTVFDIYLPAANSAIHASTGETANMPMGRESILFVDDEKILIDIGRDLLTRLGYQVETRASSLDAIEAFRANPMKYDLIISDMTMPKMDGIQLAKAIKAVRPGIPIILSSGFSEKFGSMAMKDIPAEAILMKPVAYAELADTVRRVLDGRHGGRMGESLASNANHLLALNKIN